MTTSAPLNVLVLRSSANGDASASNRLVDAWLAAHPSAHVVEHDLDKTPVPHVTSQSLAGIGRQAAEGADFVSARALADRLIDELLAADVLVIGLPLYNFGMPSTLKSWFDYVLRAGATFQYTAQGPEGLVKGKRAVIAHARGGQYDDKAGLALAVPHVRTLLGFIGITDVATVTAEGLAYGPDIAASAIEEAAKQIAELS